MQDSDAAAAGPRTLRRGLAVLAALRDQGPDGLSVTDIARLTGIQRPTIYRLLAALLDAGLVLPVTGTKKYRAQLAVDPDTRSRDPRVRQLLPVLRRLADRTGDAVFLVVRDEDDSISLHREIGSYPVQILATYAGKRQPLGVGSGGMALLAALPDEVARGIVERNSGRLDEYGGMTPQEMYRLIENTRARGYSVVGNHAVRARWAWAARCWTRMARRCWPSASPRSSTACRRSASARSPAGSRPSWQGWRRRPSRRGPFDGATAPSNAVRRTLGLEPDLAPASALEQLIQHLEEFPLGRLVRLAQRIQEGGGLGQRYFLAQVTRWMKATSIQRSASPARPMSMKCSCSRASTNTLLSPRSPCENTGSSLGSVARSRSSRSSGVDRSGQGSRS